MTPDETSETDPDATPVAVPPFEEAPSSTGVVIEEDDDDSDASTS